MKKDSRTMKRIIGISVLLLLGLTSLLYAQPKQSLVQEYPVPAGSHPHDVAPASDGSVWYVAQRSGELGRLYPATGYVRRIKLGDKSNSHCVIVGSDVAPCISYSGLNVFVGVE